MEISEYLVWELQDVLEVCSRQQLVALESIGQMIALKRKEDGKQPDGKYYIVSKDEPYADKVKAIMEAHADIK